MQKKLPIGIENFEDMIKENYYYVDKTGLLKQLLNEHGLVNLFTRPRRFGKSLNMSMLKYFFEIGNDQAIFEGLEISKDKELCDQYQGKFPVISVSLKGAKAGNYEDAKAMMKYIMAAESRRLYDRMSGDKLSEKQKEQMKSLMSDNMKDTELMTALWILSSILKEYYGKKRENSLIKAMQTHKAKNMMDFLSEKRSELGVLREDDISKPLIALRSSVEERIHPKHD